MENEDKFIHKNYNSLEEVLTRSEIFKKEFLSTASRRTDLHFIDMNIFTTRVKDRYVCTITYSLDPNESN